MPRPATPNSTPPVGKPSPTTVKCCSRPTRGAAAASSTATSMAKIVSPSSSRTGRARFSTAWACMCAQSAARISSCGARGGGSADGRAGHVQSVRHGIPQPIWGPLANWLEPAPPAGAGSSPAGPTTPQALATSTPRRPRVGPAAQRLNVVGRRRGSARSWASRERRGTRSLRADRYGGGVHRLSMHHALVLAALSGALLPRRRPRVRRRRPRDRARVLPGQLRFDKKRSRSRQAARSS